MITINMKLEKLPCNPLVLFMLCIVLLLKGLLAMYLAQDAQKAGASTEFVLLFGFRVFGKLVTDSSIFKWLSAVSAFHCEPPKHLFHMPLNLAPMINRPSSQGGTVAFISR